MQIEIQRWTVGDIAVTGVVEAQTSHIPPELFFPEARAADVVAHDWLRPDHADGDGNVTLQVQAFFVEVGDRLLLVDPCVGNGRTRMLPFWHEQSFPFLERVAEAGFSLGDVDVVVHTHLHADHVGWGTVRDGGRWVPACPNARYLYTQRALDAVRERRCSPDDAAVWSDAIEPVLDAGLGVIVEEDEDLGDGLRLEPSPGHTPGHVSLWLRSNGRAGLVSGDFLHHPVQCAHPEWAEIGDVDAEAARATRRAMFTRVADADVLFVGTHFAAPSAGRIASDGDRWRFVPIR